MVLSEGWHSEEKKMMKGLSDNYLPVLFPSLQDTNQFVSVRMERVVKDMVVGSLNIRR